MSTGRLHAGAQGLPQAELGPFVAGCAGSVGWGEGTAGEASNQDARCFRKVSTTSERANGQSLAVAQVKAYAAGG